MDCLEEETLLDEAGEFLFTKLSGCSSEERLRLIVLR